MAFGLLLSVQLVSKISNLCDPDPPTSQRDRRTDGRTEDDMQSQYGALHYSASRGKSQLLWHLVSISAWTEFAASFSRSLIKAHSCHAIPLLVSPRSYSLLISSLFLTPPSFTQYFPHKLFPSQFTVSVAR